VHQAELLLHLFLWLKQRTDPILTAQHSDLQNLFPHTLGIEDCEPFEILHIFFRGTFQRLCR
jgi:hypothetical protein